MSFPRHQCVPGFDPCEEKIVESLYTYCAKKALQEISQRYNDIPETARERKEKKPWAKAVFRILRKQSCLICNAVPDDFPDAEIFSLYKENGCSDQVVQQRIQRKYDIRRKTASEANLSSRQDAARQRALNTDRVHSATSDIINNWPPSVEQLKKVEPQCISSYYEATSIEVPRTCIVCSRCRIGVSMTEHILNSFSKDFLAPVLIDDTVLKWLPDGHSQFKSDHQELNDLMIEEEALYEHNGVPHFSVCLDCTTALQKSHLPKFSLKNHLYRGRLPKHLRDLTWMEEKLAARYSPYATVVRIYGRAKEGQVGLMLRGNTCAHMQNTCSVAEKLPRLTSDMADQITVVFIGPRRPTSEELGPIFRVRRTKVLALLKWLKSIGNPHYQDIIIDPLCAAELPEDGVPEFITQSITHIIREDAHRLFEVETAGLVPHPAEVIDLPPGSTDEQVAPPFIDSMGMMDADHSMLPARKMKASAFRNLYDTANPDVIVPTSQTAVPEYSNPDLFPGMFPTLFPLGISGFELHDRKVPISLQKQGEYYLDLKDKSFREHRFFMFFVFNILQRRQGHLQTHLTVSKPMFPAIAAKLNSLSPDLVNSVAAHLENEGKLDLLTPDQRGVLDVLNTVKAVSSHVVGSEAYKHSCRAEIRSYMVYFGLPSLYITLNPAPSHSPIFQVFFGDQSVDLSQRFPRLVSSTERVLRLARDPVAAADFFEFMIFTFFEYLLGWDHKKKLSKVEGGIFGHLKAWYGMCEATERGVLHGHFLLWLLGGLSPREVHARLHQTDKEFESRFFAFFEHIIHHHLPEMEIYVSPEQEPRAQRPPKPGCENYLEQVTADMKILGEQEQRHTCRDVCHKYGHEEDCRFQFPHQVEPISYFDAETNSVVFKTLDGTVNYFNWIVLVYCRHNHDCKPIYSGEGAKRAMIYITDYITKGDLNTHQQLSLLSAAIASVPRLDDMRPAALSKRLLQKCISQLSRQQQVPAQRVVRYLRGCQDDMKSHATLPLMSGRLLGKITGLYDKITEEKQPRKTLNLFGPEEEENSDSDSDDHDADDVSEMQNITATNGKINENMADQFTDYFLRGSSTANLSYYMFCAKLSKKKKVDLKSPKKGYTHGNTAPRHPLHEKHPQFLTHELVEHNEILPPRLIGAAITRNRESESFARFVVAHLKPFSLSNPLKESEELWQKVLESTVFSSEDEQIRKNLGDLAECEDERDAERIRRRERATRALNVAWRGVQVISTETELSVIYDKPPTAQALARLKMTDQILEDARHCGWVENLSCLNSPAESVLEGSSNSKEKFTFNTYITPTMLKKWNSARRKIEAECVAARIARVNSAEQPLLQTPATASESSSVAVILKDEPYNSKAVEPPEAIISLATIVRTADEASAIAEQIAVDWNLNEKQSFAYRILSRKFMDILSSSNTDPLRMFMTGPGGTGKTRVVLAFVDLMKNFGKDGWLRTLAPTGNAAALINGMTIHSGLQIPIRQKVKSSESYVATLDVNKREALRKEWSSVKFLVLDEISMCDQALLSGVDQALKFATERYEEWYGGINIVASGDLYQYAPVGAPAVYTPIPDHTKGRQTNQSTEQRLGRLAWKAITTVVTFTEQERMKSDPEYAATVQRLRQRCCTEADVQLLNSRVTKSKEYPQGIDFKDKDAVAIVGYNSTRTALNISKAMSFGQPYKLLTGKTLDLVVCAAYDVGDCGRVLGDEARARLLKSDFGGDKNSLPSHIPYFVGMPVIIRERNISVDLKITKGSRGIVRYIQTRPGPGNLVFGQVIIVELPAANFKLPDLPENHFPITPISWSFDFDHFSEDGILVREKMTRQQFPLEPLFAITGHSSQGQTLPSIWTSLQGGGFGAYVAASRPSKRTDIALMTPVQLTDLNKCLPPDLLDEERRLVALSTNTLFKYRDILPKDTTSSSLPVEEVPVPDVEINRDCTVPKVTFEVTVTGKRAKNLKRARAQVELDDTNTGNEFKKGRLERHSVEEFEVQDHALDFLPRGPRWTDNSCAYDAAWVIMSHMFFNSSDAWKDLLSQTNPLLKLKVVPLLVAQERTRMTAPDDVDDARDKFRHILSEKEPSSFVPRSFASVARIFELLIGSDPQVSSLVNVISHECLPEPQLRNRSSIPSLCYAARWSAVAEQCCLTSLPTSTSTTSDWFKALMTTPSSSQSAYYICSECERREYFGVGVVLEKPAFLFLELWTEGNTVIEREVILPGIMNPVHYVLSGIIYLGDNHFTAMITTLDGIPDKYHDGLKLGGRFSLRPVSTKKAHLAIYKLTL